MSLFTHSGVNDQGNYYETPGGNNSVPGRSYTYQNADGSWYYSNDDGSTYYHPGPNAPQGAAPHHVPGRGRGRGRGGRGEGNGRGRGNAGGRGGGGVGGGRGPGRGRGGSERGIGGRGRGRGVSGAGRGGRGSGQAGNPTGGNYTLQWFSTLKKVHQHVYGSAAGRLPDVDRVEAAAEACELLYGVLEEQSDVHLPVAVPPPELNLDGSNAAGGGAPYAGQAGSGSSSNNHNSNRFSSLDGDDDDVEDGGRGRGGRGGRGGRRGRGGRSGRGGHGRHGDADEPDNDPQSAAHMGGRQTTWLNFEDATTGHYQARYLQWLIQLCIAEYSSLKANLYAHKREWTECTTCAQHAVVVVHQAYETLILDWYSYNTGHNPENHDFDVLIELVDPLRIDQSAVEERFKGALRKITNRKNKLRESLNPLLQDRDAVRERWGEEKWNNNPHPKKDYAEQRRWMEEELRDVEAAETVIISGLDVVKQDKGSLATSGGGV